MRGPGTKLACFLIVSTRYARAIRIGSCIVQSHAYIHDWYLAFWGFFSYPWVQGSYPFGTVAPYKKRCESLPQYWESCTDFNAAVKKAIGHENIRANSL